MRAIELVTEIDEQHEIHLKLPDDCEQGKARVIVLVGNEEQPSVVPKERKFGQFRGKIRLSEDFDEPLPDEFWTGSKS